MLLLDEVDELSMPPNMLPTLGLAGMEKEGMLGMLGMLGRLGLEKEGMEMEGRGGGMVMGAGGDLT